MFLPSTFSTVAVLLGFIACVLKSSLVLSSLSTQHLIRTLILPPPWSSGLAIPPCFYRPQLAFPSPTPRLACCKAGGRQLLTLATPNSPGAALQRKYSPNVLSPKILIQLVRDETSDICVLKSPRGDSNLQSGLSISVRGFPAFSCKLRSPTAFITSPFSPAERR